MSQQPPSASDPQPRFQEFTSPPSQGKGASGKGKSTSGRQSGATHDRPTVSFTEFSGQPTSPKPKDYAVPKVSSPAPASAKAPVMSQAASSPPKANAGVNTAANDTANVASVPSPTPDSPSTQSLTTAPPSPTEIRSKLASWLKSLGPVIWAIVIAIVIIPLAGRLIIAKSVVSPGDRLAPHQELTVSLPPRLNQLDQAVVSALQTAHQETRAYAAAELSTWVTELEPRVDNFLDWYFDYFTQKKLEISAPLVWLRSAVGKFVGVTNANPGDAVNAELTKTFQKEFTKRVLVPQTAQLRLEVITTSAAEHFVAALSQQMSEVQVKYRIPQGQWERYLDTIATTISDTEGNLSNLSLKALVGGTGYLAVKPFLLASLGKLGSKLSTKFAAKATAKVAAKTGTSVAAELGTSLIDPIVGVGILIWDLWDYKHTVAVDRPLLRRNIDGYLQSMQRSLLDNPETGIMAAINQLESVVTKNLKNNL